MYSAKELEQKCLVGAQALKKILAEPYLANPRELIAQKNKLRLFRYANKYAVKKKSIPVLIVFATVNRPEILDLLPETSFINGLLKNGEEVFLLDWGYPDKNDGDMKFSDYIEHQLTFCVNTILKKTKQEKLNLIGICQGGVISLCYTALNDKINKLILISTPIDFKKRNNIISTYLGKINIEDLRQFSGNVSGSVLTNFFISMRPFELLGKKYLRYLDNMQNLNQHERFLRIEKWLHDTPDQPRLAFSQFIENFYHENQLIKGNLKLGKRNVRLENINVPVLNIIASKDEIVPASASSALKKYIKPEFYHQRQFSAGHIGIYVSPVITLKLTKMISKWLNNGKGFIA